MKRIVGYCKKTLTNFSRRQINGCWNPFHMCKVMKMDKRERESKSVINYT